MLRGGLGHVTRNARKRQYENPGLISFTHHQANTANPIYCALNNAPMNSSSSIVQYTVQINKETEKTSWHSSEQ